MIATYAVGFQPCRLLFRDVTTAIAINAGPTIWSESTGDFAVVDLADPSAVPAVRRIPRLRRLQAAALDASGTNLVLLYGGEPDSDTDGGMSTTPRFGVVNPATGRVRVRGRIPRKRGFGADIAITPDAKTILVGTTRGVQYLRLGRPQ